MNMIQMQVRRARRRLILAKFAYLLCWTLCIAWTLSAIAIIAAAVWSMPVDTAVWGWAWVASSTTLAIAVAMAIALYWAPSITEVAREVDARFGLRERLSSVMTLPLSDRETAMGQALVADAVQRAEPLDVGERFLLSPNRFGWLPVLPAALVVLAMLVGPAIAPHPELSLTPELVSQTNQVKTAAEALKRKIQQQRVRAEESGLKDAEDFFKKLETDLDKLTQRPSLDQKDAMIAMNDIKKQLDQRRDELGSPEQMKSALAKMGDVEQGPASNIVKAMQKGDFAEAQKEVKELAEKLRAGKLTPQEQEQLKQQIEQIRDKLNQAAEKNAEAKKQLQQQIDQANKEGRPQDAAKMQQQMNQLEAQGAQLQQMQQMGEAMNQAAQAMKEGKTGEAADALENMADQLGEMQSEMEQLEDLADTLDNLAQSKDQMRCSSCEGGGCGQCQGQGNGQGNKQGDGQNNSKGSALGQGIGKGRGSGELPEDIEAGTYDSQVRGEPKQGRGVVAGFADGPNRKGVSREEIKDAVLGAISDKSDPLENQALPRVERDHARQYFDRLRQGPVREAAAP